MWAKFKMKYCFLSQSRTNTARKMKFSVKDFLRKCDQIRRFLRIWSYLLKKSLMENFIFYVAKIFETKSRNYGTIGFSTKYITADFLQFFSKIEKKLPLSGPLAIRHQSQAFGFSPKLPQILRH